ncbi:MAG: hypothetical protein ABGY95_00250 [Rubritalea sp.]|uniref:hypothetical protein n=1 Tax=Rubritalea sp. TaxID=2109375 RepID=UPI0032421489
MSLVRIAQAFIVLISTLVGSLALYIWQPTGKLLWVDNLVSPVRNEIFAIGGKIEDSTIGETRDRIIRKIAHPDHSALDYVICQIDDDPEQVNAFGLYHPADLAITLHNLKDQGVKRIFLSTHLHWPELEPEENNTLATAMRSFDSVVVTAPLRRALSSEPLPPSFIMASIPASEVIGGAERFPVVNSLGISQNIDFPKNTYAGFNVLESEKPNESLPMAARWGDRIVFSSVLLALMQKSKITPNQLIVHSGEYIRIGNSGNIIPIDSFGHFHPDPNFIAKTPARQSTSALSGESSIIGATQKNAILTATGVKSSEFEAIGDPYFKLSQLAYTPRVSGAEKLKRLPIWLECILVVGIAIVSAWLLAYSKLRRNTAFLISLFSIWFIFLILYHALQYWSPVSIHTLTLLTGWLLSIILAKPAHRALA